MKTIRRITALVLCTVVLLTLTACSSKKQNLQIFSAGDGELYAKAFEKNFSNVTLTDIDMLDKVTLSGNADGTLSAEGSINEDTRYVVIISDDQSVLDRSAAAGKRFTALVWDDGSTITMHVKFCIGTTENCVSQGKVVSGEMSYSNNYTIPGTAGKSPEERAEIIATCFYNAAAEVEGK